MSIPRVIKNANCSGVLPRQPIHPAQDQDGKRRSEHTSMPTVECVRDGDNVRYIDVHCCCGQVTRLLCEYATTPSNEPTSP
jgi:hypothetical protein